MTTPSTATTSPADKPANKIVKTTLGEWGAKLPIGVEMEGTDAAPVKPFRLRDFTTAREKEVGRLKDKSKKNKSLGTFVSDVLTVMVQTVGPHNFDKMDEKQRRLALAMLRFPDVMYLWCYLRYESMDHEPIAMHIKCPYCGHGYRFDADMATMDVKVLPEGGKVLSRLTTLKKGIIIRDTKRGWVKWTVPRWALFESNELAVKNQTEREAVMARNTIVDAEGFVSDSGTPLMVLDDEIDTLYKYDRAGLFQDIEEYTPGPVMTIETTCEGPGCGEELRQMIDWRYESFFTRLPQGMNGKT